MTRQKEVRAYGGKGTRVLVFVELMASGNRLVRVGWREHNRRRFESWQYSTENVKRAKLFAEGVHNRLQSRGVIAKERLTLHTLFERYVLAREGGWRPKTGKTERVRWRVVENVLGAKTPIEHVSPETLDEFRSILRKAVSKTKKPLVPNQIAAHIGQIKRVFRFAAERGYLTPNPIGDYANRLSKDERREEVAEYTPAEFGLILGALDYRDVRRWRPWVAIVLGGMLGARQRALMSLTQDDLDLTARVVHWPRATDKLGRARTQPLPREAVFALRVANVWRRRMGYTGRWVFPPVQGRRGDQPWTYQALQKALHDAETRAGMDPKPFRAMHGLRRMAAKNALTLTGNLKEAGDWIGDTDVRTLARSYLRQRNDEQRPLANQMGTIAPVPRNVHGSGTQPALTTEADECEPS